MSDIQKQKRWFTSLNSELSKYFNVDEKQEIVDYYEEMINDKLDAGQNIDYILNQYDPKQIARSMIPKVVSNRTSDKKNKTTKKNIWLILVILFTTPLWIPIGVVFLVLVILAFVFVVTGFALMASGVGFIFTEFITMFGQGLVFNELALQLGVSLIVLAILLSVGYAMILSAWKGLGVLAKWIGKLLSKEREE